MFGSWVQRGVWWGRRRGEDERKVDSRTDDLCGLGMRSGGFCRRLGMGGEEIAVEERVMNTEKQHSSSTTMELS